LPATRDTESPASRALRALRALPDPLAPRHARLTATADGATLARAASTSTAEGRLTVSFPPRPQDPRRVGRPLNALPSGNAPTVPGAQGAATRKASNTAMLGQRPSTPRRDGLLPAQEIPAPAEFPSMAAEPAPLEPVAEEVRPPTPIDPNVPEGVTPPRRRGGARRELLEVL